MVILEQMTKAIFIIALTLLLTNLGFGQNSTVSNKQLTQHEIDSIFTDSVKTEFNINFDIFRVYEYQDKIGKQLLLLTESISSKENTAESMGFILSSSDVFHDSIRAFKFNFIQGRLDLTWSLNDFIIENEYSEEYSISFWTKYFELGDYDGDGMIDPIVVYGTLGMNGTSDGRIKILVYYKGEKRAIRHQNGTLDWERNTQIDEMYYKLPQGIQVRVKNIMESIMENNHGIFPRGWQTAMALKDLEFEEFYDGDFDGIDDRN